MSATRIICDIHGLPLVLCGCSHPAINAEPDPLITSIEALLDSPGLHPETAYLIRLAALAQQDPSILITGVEDLTAPIGYFDSPNRPNP